MKVAQKKKLKVRYVILIVFAALILAAAAWKLAATYGASHPKFSYIYGSTSADASRYPDTKFAVICDTHYYDTSLGTEGPAFEKYLDSDRKLLRQSASLLILSVDRILNSGVRFVLVCGDLTKDGELLDHQDVAFQLQRLVDKGIKVYVVPGNHDVSNPESVKYDGDISTHVQNISPTGFAELYKNCGYQDALLRDSGSLSYVSEPQDGLWVVALDTCEYQKNIPGGLETVAGQLTQHEIGWLEGVFRQANEKGKAIIILEHHGVVEHWNGQSKLHPDYLLSDYKYIGKFYSSYGVRLAFTGHYHAQDITLEDNGNTGFLYDIETGSLITPPCPIRICVISNNSITIKTENLIDTFSAYEKDQAWTFVVMTIRNEAYNTLEKYFVKPSDANYIADIVSKAFWAHYSGDENPANRVPIDTSRLNLWSRFIYSQYQYAVDGLWKDLPPADNNCTLNLSHT